MKKNIIDLIIITSVFGVAAWLRLAGLANNPHWYSDEGTHLDIARHTLLGETRYLAIDQSVLLFARLPLFNWVLSGWMSLFGRLLPQEQTNMLTLRTLTALCGVGCVFVTYWLIQYTTQQKPLALIAATILAIWQPVILYSRFGFSYDLLALLVLVAIYGATRALQNHSRTALNLFAVAIGLALIAEIWSLALLPLIGLFGLVWLKQNGIKQWRDGIVATVLLILPLGGFVIQQLLYNADAFLFDLNFTFGRVSDVSFAVQIDTLQTNLLMLMRHYWLVPFGLLGMAFVPTRELRAAILLTFWVPFLIIGRTVPLFSLSFYYTIPLLPLICIGVATLAWRLLHHLQPYRWGWRIACLAVLVVLGSEFWSSAKQVEHGFVSGIEPFLVDGDAAQLAADWVNERVTEENVVIASPAIAWLLNANVADFQFSAAAIGLETPHLPATGLEDRFVFNPHYANATFIITDNLWHNWATIHVPQVAEMLIELDEWQVVFSAENITVYRQRP